MADTDKLIQIAIKIVKATKDIGGERKRGPGGLEAYDDPRRLGFARTPRALILDLQRALKDLGHPVSMR